MTKADSSVIDVTPNSQYMNTGRQCLNGGAWKSNIDWESHGSYRSPNVLELIGVIEYFNIISTLL